MASAGLKLPPGATLVDAGMKLPPGATLVSGSQVPGYDVQANADLLRQGKPPQVIQAPEPPPGQGLSNLGSDLLGMAKSAPGVLRQMFPVSISPYGVHVEPSVVQGAEPIYKSAQQQQQAYPDQYDSSYPVAAAIGGTLGANVSGMQQSANQGDVGGVLGHAAAVPVAIGLTLGAAKGIKELNRPSPPPPPDTVARNITQAVNPATAEWPSYMRATQDVGGNIVDYATRNNLPLKTQLDYAKAARAMAKEASGYFNTKIVAPVAEQPVSVAGTGYKGPTVGEGQTAKLGDVNARIGKINDTLRSNYVKSQAGQVLTALADDAELNAEKQALTDVLHKELGARTGIAPEAIAGLRQQIGKAFTVADQTEAAVNQRQSGISRAKEGQPTDVPTTMAGMAKGAVNKLRGGPEGISNRAFRKAAAGLAPSQIDLPEVNPPQAPPSSRTPLYQQQPVPVQQAAPTAPPQTPAEPFMGTTVRARRAAARVMQTPALPPAKQAIITPPPPTEMDILNLRDRLLQPNQPLLPPGIPGRPPVITPPPPTEMDFLNLRDRLSQPNQPLLPAGHPPLITPPPPIDYPGSLERAASVKVPDYAANKMRTQYLTGNAVDQIMQMAKDGKISPGEADRRIRLLGKTTRIVRPQAPPR